MIMWSASTSSRVDNVSLLVDLLKCAFSAATPAIIVEQNRTDKTSRKESNRIAVPLDPEIVHVIQFYFW